MTSERDGQQNGGRIATTKGTARSSKARRKVATCPTCGRGKKLTRSAVAMILSAAVSVLALAGAAALMVRLFGVLW